MSVPQEWLDLGIHALFEVEVYEPPIEMPAEINAARRGRSFSLGTYRFSK